MLLNMMCGRRLPAISLCLAVTFAPLFNAQADEPEVIPGDSPVAVSEQGEALPQAQATAIMAGIDLDDVAYACVATVRATQNLDTHYATCTGVVGDVQHSLFLDRSSTCSSPVRFADGNSGTANYRH